MKTKSLKGKTALITGAAKRIGRYLALELAKQGCNIIVHFHSTPQKEIDNLVSELSRGNIQVSIIKADLTDLKETENIFPLAFKKNTKIDILINNASIFLESNLSSVTIHELNQAMMIHAYAPLILSRSFAAQSKGGHIINFLDTRIESHDFSHVAYHLSKLMLYHLTKMLAIELAPHTRVNAIAPGAILPPIGQDASYLRKLEKNIPLKHCPSLSDIYQAVHFLINTPSLTGQVIFVDGGKHLTGGIYGKK